MIQIILSLYSTFVVQIHSKRFWAMVTSIVTIVTAAFFEKYQKEALEIVAILAVWMTADTIRPSGGGKSNDLVARWHEALKVIVSSPHTPGVQTIDKPIDYDPTKPTQGN